MNMMESFSLLSVVILAVGSQLSTSMVMMEGMQSRCEQEFGNLTLNSCFNDTCEEIEPCEDTCKPSCEMGETIGNGYCGRNCMCCERKKMIYGSECMDTSDNCEDNKFQCNTNKKTMENCKKTCGMCKGHVYD